MYKVVRAVVVSVGVLALSALASVSASAATAGWMVNGTNLTGSAAVATTAAVDQEGVLRGGGLTITCTGSTGSAAGPEIKASNKGAASSVEYSGCSAEAPCTLGSGTIKTVPVSSEATLEGVLAVVVTVKPETGTLFTTIKFSGAECGLSGTTPIKGSEKFLEPTGQDERTLQLANAITTEASGELLLGASAASTSGSALGRLASGLTWSFL